ncbi:MAG: hypothetical protein K2G49_00450 [Muribaculum sp.]|nr:hypothetical protein [Muribaculum sp.]
MAREVTNYGRFFAAFNRLTIHGDRDEARRQFVLQYTGGRTDSLRGMTHMEYTCLCIALEDVNANRDEIRRCRSIVLKLLQELGVDTTDWSRIDAFCLQPRISGKRFGQLSAPELMELDKKLRAIRNKGWQTTK